VAEWVVARLTARDAFDEEYLQAALAEIRRFASAEASEHLWIFRDPIALVISDNVFAALDERPDGTRDWLQADTASAVAAVARFDVIVAVSELACDVAAVESAEGLPTEGAGSA
jgi:hypothetical protein